MIHNPFDYFQNFYFQTNLLLRSIKIYKRILVEITIIEIDFYQDQDESLKQNYQGGKMSCQYEVYVAKNCTTTQSYLITLIDGTGSMSGEYEAVVDAHNATFSCLGSQQMKYQWE
ncbi:unnamed protein product (macronuclear) [Paramecium tetraurelia]|uniref:Uncharacterized protein n=1 Tax=Paramecium tetraurelia TaxID=5888 RepID=A0EGR4_PARTE|nr:uncharacterized protein GSPATT00026829001 [Paramecium tetraurelia]CAK94505.1 unnamed protein product [Paramecium tetraurelia]|eukprot:XP_001461878.1 hypothetical protein (macronuclear) [Paramecium tetraurelia strain d4-2]